MLFKVGESLQSKDTLKHTISSPKVGWGRAKESLLFALETGLPLIDPNVYSTRACPVLPKCSYFRLQAEWRIPLPLELVKTSSALSKSGVELISIC